jgi:hypothetical protein
LVPNAEADLRWYWGTGPETWAGDAGLRSGSLERESSGGYDLSAIEDRMLDRCQSAARARHVEERLRALSGHEVSVLRTHFTGGSLPFGISAAAIFTSAALDLVPAGRTGLASYVAEVARQCRLSVKTRERIERFVLTLRRLPKRLTTEHLREPLADASQVEREAIMAETDALVGAAIQAYESTTVEHHRRVWVY